MRRVNSAAFELKKQGYAVKTYVPRNFRSTIGNLNKLDIEANRSWLAYWIKQKNAKVFDVGIDETTSIRSPFYNLEHRSIYNNWHYKNVVKLEGY